MLFGLRYQSGEPFLTFIQINHVGLSGSHLSVGKSFRITAKAVVIQWQTSRPAVAPLSWVTAWTVTTTIAAVSPSQRDPCQPTLTCQRRGQQTSVRHYTLCVTGSRLWLSPLSM